MASAAPGGVAQNEDAIALGISVGSVGHPHSCALPCWFITKPTGCALGEACIRCHLCVHTKCRGKRSSEAKRSAKASKKASKQCLHQSSVSASFDEAVAAALSLGGSVCTVGLPHAVDTFGVVVPTELDALLLDDVSHSAGAILKLQEHLTATGFTAAPNSKELVDLANRLPEQDIEILRRRLENGMPPGLHSASLVEACVCQLKQVLSDEVVILGLYKAQARICSQDNASSLHKDDVIVNEDKVRRALFPNLADSKPCDGNEDSKPCDGNGLFHYFNNFCADAKLKYPVLELPSFRQSAASFASSDEMQAVTLELIDGIRRYNQKQAAREEELVFDNVNVWIPRDTKQILVLPLASSADLQYPLTPDAVEKLRSSCTQRFQALPRSKALFFFGQSLLHQALIGPDFDCGTGSVEGRFLVLTRRGQAHSDTLRDRVFEEPRLFSEVHTQPADELEEFL